MGGDGVSVDALVVALNGIQDAMRLMVGHLGDRQQRPGRPPKWVIEQSNLRLTATRSGSFVAELALEQPPGGRTRPEEGYGERAIAALHDWDGSEGASLPKAVTDKLFEIPSALPKGQRLWLGAVDTPRRVEIKRTERAAKPASRSEIALLHGWLNAVDWDRRAAQLRVSGGGYVPLRFDAALSEDMRRLATQFVEIRGRGRFNKDGDWTRVEVERISGTRSWQEPFDVEAFLNEPNPKVFRSSEVIRASDPFDVDEFTRGIREGRDG